MPAELLAAGIQSGTSILNNAMNLFAQSQMNRKERQWNEKMYGMQRADALSDFNRQNEYNSPTAQMDRLKMAGLNPNLVYGNGATTTSAPIRSTDVHPWNPKPMHFDLDSAAQNGLSAYYDTQVKQAQIDNLKTQNTVMVQDAALKAAQTLGTMANAENTGVRTDISRYDLEVKPQLAQYSVEAAKLAVDKLGIGNDVTLQANDRANAMMAPTLQLAAARILQTRAQTANTVQARRNLTAQADNIEHDTQLKQLDIELKKMGIQPGDALWQRMLGRIVNSTGGPGSIRDAAARGLKAFRAQDFGTKPGTHSPLDGDNSIMNPAGAIKNLRTILGW